MLRDYQLDIVSDIVNGKHKHLLLIAPRRSGKSVLVFYLVNALINKIWADTKMPVNATIFAPEQKQCRAIYIDNILSDGKKLLEISNGKFLESRLSLEYSFNSKIKFSGSDMIDSHMGSGNKIIVLDEYALSKPEAFQRVYPMIQSTAGHMIVCSTPRGRNHLHELHEQVKNNPEWLVIHTDVFKLGLMTQEEYDALPMHENYKRQEFLCSWDSPFENAIYLEPNVAKLSINHGLGVYIGIDLGIRDATAAVICQLENGKINIIHSFETTNTSLEDVYTILMMYLMDKDLPFIQIMYVPHDTNQRDYITGKSRYDYLLDKGLPVQLVTRSGLMDGIEIVRKMWHNIIFNEGTMAIERVKAYITDVKTQKPKHDDASHMADAIRYLVLGLDDVINTHGTMGNTYERMYRTDSFNRKV
jgi:phage terminase large subunit